jgi:7,8-didemethyl-8-hydroxy-5-deazariboflavin synthase CofG subunit
MFWKCSAPGSASVCREALFVLGERPEERYPEARRWLKEHGYDSTLEYLYDICKLTLSESALYPHSNAGNMTRRELEALKEVNVSMGLMLENVSERLCAPGGPHERAPSKHPQARLETLRHAGDLKIPFTTGLLIGMGENARERTDSLVAIRDLHERYGHIQEVIVQNFQANADTLRRRPASSSVRLTSTWRAYWKSLYRDRT